MAKADITIKVNCKRAIKDLKRAERHIRRKRRKRRIDPIYLLMALTLFLFSLPLIITWLTS